MKDRLDEKADNAKQGKMKRVTMQDIRPSQRNSPDEMAAAGGNKLITTGGAEERKGSGSNLSDGGMRRGSTKMNSPSFQKVDVNLKKKLLAEEKERTEKAKRDAIDERQREQAEFKQSGHATTANIIHP